MTQWTVAIPAASLFVATVAAFFAVRAHMRSLNRLRLGYGFTEPVTVGMKPDPGDCARSGVSGPTRRAEVRRDGHRE